MNCKVCGVRYESSKVEGTCDLCLPKSADRTIERWKQRAIDAEAKLKRYEERDRDLQVLIESLNNSIDFECALSNDAWLLFERVRDFKLE